MKVSCVLRLSSGNDHSHREKAARQDHQTARAYRNYGDSSARDIRFFRIIGIIEDVGLFPFLMPAAYIPDIRMIPFPVYGIVCPCVIGIRFITRTGSEFDRADHRFYRKIFLLMKKFLRLKKLI